MEKQKEEKINEIVNTIFMMANVQLQKPILEIWKEDLSGKSIEQIEYSFKRYRAEWYGKPNLALFLKLTERDPSKKESKPKTYTDGVPMPDEVKQKIENLKKKMLM